MYENGQGVKQDLFKAVQLFEKACDNGYITGCSILE
ncbi:SEL1-like repeat protein [Sulfurospirillum sp. UCH001]